MRGAVEAIRQLLVVLSSEMTLGTVSWFTLTNQSTSVSVDLTDIEGSIVS